MPTAGAILIKISFTYAKRLNLPSTAERAEKMIWASVQTAS